MKTGFVIVRVAVSGWALTMDEVYVLSTDDFANAALIGPDWWSWAAELHSRLFHLVTTMSEGGWIVPLLARSQTLDGSSILDDTEVANVILIGWTRVKGHAAVS